MQVPLVIVHSKILSPTDKPVTAVAGDREFVILPPPEINDQVPTPVVGVLPANVADVAQTV